MKSAEVYVCGIRAGTLVEHSKAAYEFTYSIGYKGPPVSLTMPYRKEPYQFGSFPPFFEGLLPEGLQLEALIKQKKINKYDYFSQLLAVGGDLVGAVTVKELK